MSIDEKGSVTNNTPGSIVLFITLGVGIIFVNVIVITGIRYIWRKRNFQGIRNISVHSQDDTGAIEESNGRIRQRSAHRRRRRRNLQIMTEAQIREQFPIMTYKHWKEVASREDLNTGEPRTKTAPEDLDSTPSKNSTTEDKKTESIHEETREIDDTQSNSDSEGEISQQQRSASGGRTGSQEQRFSTSRLSSLFRFSRSNSIRAARRSLNGSRGNSDSQEEDQELQELDISDLKNVDIEAQTYTPTASRDSRVGRPISRISVSSRRPLSSASRHASRFYDGTLEEGAEDERETSGATTTFDTAEEDEEEPLEIVMSHRNSTQRIPISEDSSGTCAICIDDYEDDSQIRVLTCGHTFHDICIDPWLLNRRACCPLCKASYYTPKPFDPLGPDPPEEWHRAVAVERIEREATSTVESYTTHRRNLLSIVRNAVLPTRRHRHENDRDQELRVGEAHPPTSSQ